MPEISVIIPTWNRRKLLLEAIASCLNQRNVDMEIIVVDDGSTDDTLAYLKYIPSIQIISQEHKGPPFGLNVGLQRATGTYIKFLDSDDVLSSDSLSEQIHMIQDQNADVLYGDWEFCTAQGVPFGGRNGRSEENFLDSLLTGWWYPNFAYLFRHDFLTSHQLFFDEEFSNLIDFRFILSVAQSGAQFRYAPIHAGFYRRHQLDQTISQADETIREALRLKILEKTRDELLKNGKLSQFHEALITTKSQVLAKTLSL